MLFHWFRCGHFAERGRVKHLTLRFLGAHSSTVVQIESEKNDDGSVSATTFASFVLKCGLSKKTLHKKLYPYEFGQSARAGEYPIAVAASGGADSMALMLLLREYLQENCITTPLLVITVDHQLRHESSKEALEVAKICDDHGGMHHITKVCEWYREADLSRPAKPRDSKMEEQARQKRYDLLRQACLEHRVRCLFVGHNYGDQIETTLFRLGRASSINGLAGMASRLPFIPADESFARSRETEDLKLFNMAVLIRPLLSVTKDRLMATCNRFQQTWIHDPSNDNPVYDRVRIRQELKRVERERGTAILDLFSRFQQTAKKAKKEFACVERSILCKYIVIWEPEFVVIQSTILYDPEIFNELLYRLLSIITVHVGNKETPPRLASVARLARDLPHLETGKQRTLGGCRIQLIANGHQIQFQSEYKTK
ncbi:unnamed protein product [Peronospora belbahrii]|uniref:tRNA(Ile)-lysidine synthetase n=1 Tax=Peronospora belbahrii TaxID=622444 RepID=A0AAU9KYH9_9STRA|nr:unnamed protein product [Peronospora belbahrii]